MTGFIAPWSPNFTNDINSVIGEVTAVVDSVVPGAIPVAPPVAQPIDPNVITTPPKISVVPPGTSVTGGFEQAAEAGAKAAWTTLAPQIQRDIANYAEAYVQRLLAGNPTPGVPNVTYNGQSLTQAAAKGHALRTFLIGMSTTALSAVTSAIASQGNVDFFSKEGWTATATLAVGTLVSTVISYVGRLQVTPEFEKQLAAAPAQLLK